VDLYSTFVLRIVALQFVDFRQFLVVIPWIHHLLEWQEFIDGRSRHFGCCVAECFIMLASHVPCDAALSICFESITFHTI
jgi:hypothetical protein